MTDQVVDCNLGINMELLKNEKENPDRVVVRLSTISFICSRGGIHQKKSITFLRRKCKGFNVLSEDARNSSAEDTFSRIENLHECEDGIYEVVTCNESRDFESGYIDDYDFRLVPLKEEKPQNP